MDKDSKDSDELTKTLVVGRKYQLLHKIGSGSFGDVYRAMNLRNGQSVAVKLENKNTTMPQLRYESRILRLLNGGEGRGRRTFPYLWWYGEVGIYNALVMDLLGPSLEDLFSFCSRRFSLKTVLMVADQMIECVEFLHNKNFIHRDIKPDNFLIGLGANSHKVYLVDFGLSKRFTDPISGGHIPHRVKKLMAGTVRYTSLNSHLGIEKSRRDDLESIGYVLMYFIRGELPWQGLTAATKKEKYDKIGDVKKSTTVDILCDGHPEFANYIKYCRGLSFDSVPDYMHLKRIFRELFRTMNYHHDFLYDWKIRVEKKHSSHHPQLPPAPNNVMNSPKFAVVEAQKCF